MTRRTNLRKFALGNWDPQVSQIYLYSLGAAALGADDGMGDRRSEAVFHQIALMGTHVHVEFTDVRARAPKIFCRAHSWSSKAINVRGYQRLGQVYDGRQISFMRMMDWSAELKQLLYQYLNPVAAGLCEKASEYDGLCSPLEWVGGHRLWVKKPEVFFGKEFPAEVVLPFGPPPAAYIAYGGDVKRMVADLRSDARKQEKAIARMRPFPVLGDRKMHPYDEPNTLVDRWTPHKPRVMIGAGGTEERKLLRQLVNAEVEKFCADHEGVRLEETAQIAGRVAGKVREEEPKIVYPYGTYQAVRERFNGVEAPSDGVYFLKPGVFDRGWASDNVECEVPEEVSVVVGKGVGAEVRLAEREESVADVSGFYASTYDKLRERAAQRSRSPRVVDVEVGEDTSDVQEAPSDSNQQKTADRADRTSQGAIRGSAWRPDGS